jgi:hypothetical protein
VAAAAVAVAAAAADRCWCGLAEGGAGVGLAELELQHTLPQPAGSDVRARLVVDGEEGGGVGMEGVKRGRRGARGWGGKRGIGSMGCKEDPGPGRIRGIRGNVIASQKTRFPCVWSHPLENKSRLT